MRYYKNVQNGYIISIGIGDGFTEITEEEYNKLSRSIEEKPFEIGYFYRLKVDLTWEKYEAPPIIDDGLEDAEICGTVTDTETM